MEVRYDALSADPEPEMKRVADFLGLPFSDAMVRFHEGRTIDNPKLSAKSAWRPAVPGLRDANALTEAELQIFDLLCGDLLDDLGLPRMSGTHDRAYIAEADRVRNLWQVGKRARPTAPLFPT